jgi:hypothetical protein
MTVHFDHFENLWEACEQHHQETSDTSVLMLINELVMKSNLYNAVEQRTELSAEDKQSSKSRIMGEILLALTHLSLKDNINVFDALNIALQYRISQQP